MIKFIGYMVVFLVIMYILNKYMDFFEVSVNEKVKKKKRSKNAFKKIYESKNEFDGYDSSN